MRYKFETLAIINTNLSIQKINGTITKVKNIITKSGGKITKIEKWGIRKLAWPMCKHERGFYFLIEFNSTAKSVNGVYKPVDALNKFYNEHTILSQKDNKEFIKHITVVKDK